MAIGRPAAPKVVAESPLGLIRFVMAAADPALRLLLSDLQQLRFAREEKTSEREILTDYLEIVAVAAGEKPSHLQGQGMRSRSFTRAIEGVAVAHGLLVMYTPPVPTHYHRAPNYDARFFEWERERERDELAKARPVLWIYRDRDLEPAIRAAADGDTDLATVLGYPACCVRENSELGIRLAEARVRGYETQYGASDATDFIRLAREDARVSIGPSEWPRFRHVFSYVQFSPCRECAERPSSPAAEVNFAMKRLATRLSPAFQRSIEKAARAEAGARARGVKNS